MTRYKQLTIIFIFLFIFSGVISTQGTSTNTPSLEELIINRVLSLYINKDGLSSGFADGSTSNANWEDTVDAIETLALLDGLSQLSRVQKAQIIRFIDMNKVDQFDQTINNSLKIDWWGETKKSVEGLRVLQLLNHQNETVTNSVKNRICNNFVQEGIQWELEGSGWDKIYWGIYKPLEWNLFDILPNIGLTRLTNSALELARGNLLEISEEELFNQTQTITWSEGVNIYDEFDTSISHDSNPRDLNIPRLQNQFIGQKITFGNKYSPVVELTVNWDVWNDDNQLSIDNFENKTFGKLSGMIQNETINTPQLITLPDGSTRIKIITQTEERWNDASLDYNLFLQVLSSSGETVAEKSVRINTFGNNHITIPIQFLNEDESYSLSSYVLQNIHQLDNSYINFTLKHNNSQELQSILNEPTINIGNHIYRIDELSIIESTNFQTTFEYLNSSEWVTNEKLVSIPLSISINTPNYGYVKLNYNPSSEEGSLIAISEHPSQTYRMLFFDNQHEDWNTLLTNYTSVRSVMMEGVNSLGISKSGSYNILLRNLNESLTYEEQLSDAFSQVSFISYKTQHHYSNAPSLIQYQNLFNQTSGDLLKTIQQQEFLNMITNGSSVTDFLNDRVVSELMFLHYNSTLQTFENNLDISPRIWKVLDSLEKSDTYLSKSDYNNTLFKFMTDNYYETLDQKTGIVKEIKLATEEQFPSEIQNLRSFGEIITYRSQWMNISDNLRTPPQQVLGYVGTAIGTIDQEIDQNAIIAMARNYAQTEIYDPETMKVIDEIIALNNPPIDSAIHIKSSKYLSSEFMFWQKENDPILINPVDLITNTFITIGIISSTVFMLVIDPKSSKNFLFINIALIGIISMQGIVAPIIMNYQNISLSKYLSTFQTFLDKIEEGIYDVSQQLGHFFAKPLEIPQQIGQGITNSINGNSVKTNYNTTLKFQYDRYLIELDKSEKIFNQLDVSPSHITRSLHSQIVPLSYNEFLMQIAEIEIQGLIADKIQEADNAAKLAKDRTLQRQLGFGEILTVLQKSVSLSDEVIMGVGRAIYSASDDIWARASNLGDMVKANDFVNHLETLQDTIKTYAKSMNKNVYEELMGSVQRLVDDPSKIFEVKLISQIPDGPSDVFDFLGRSLAYELEALSKTGIKDLAPSLAKKLHKSIITQLFDVKWENVVTHINETTNKIFSMAINMEKKSVHFITNNIDEVKNAWKSINLSDEGLSFTKYRDMSTFIMNPLSNDYLKLAPNMVKPLYKFLESLQIRDWYRLTFDISGHSGTDILKITIPNTRIFVDDLYKFGDIASDIIKESLSHIKQTISDMTKQIFSNTFESVDVFVNNNLDLLRGISNRVSDWVPRIDEFLDNIKNAAKFLPGKEAVKELARNQIYKDLIQNISDPETLFRMTDAMYDLGSKTIRIKINSGQDMMKKIIEVTKNYDGFKDLSTREIREIIESLEFKELIFKPDEIRAIIKEDIPLMKDLISKGKVVNLFAEQSQIEQLVTKLILNKGGKDLLSKLDDLNISPHLADAVKEIGTKGSFITSTSSNLATGKLDMVIKAGKRAYAAIEAWGASKSLGSSVKIGDVGRNVTNLPSKGQIDIARLYMLNITLDMDSMLIMPLKSGFTNAYEKVSKIGQLGAKHTDETIDIGVTYFGKNTIGDVFEVTQKPSLITELLRTTYIGRDKGYLKFIDDIYQEFGINAKRIMEAITESKYNSVLNEWNFAKKADNVLKEIYNDYFSLVSFSPFQSNYQMNFNWNALGNFSDQIRSDVMYVEALEEQVGNVSGIRLDSKGYFVGDVGDASMTFLVNNGGISDTLPFNFPYSVDSLNNITSDDYTFSRLIADGLIYDLDSSNPYEPIERSYVNTNGVIIRSDGAVKTSYTTNSWSYTGTGQNFVKFSQPAIEQLTGKNGISLVEYPYFNWTWQNDPYEATETEVYNTGVDMEWTNKGWNQGQISFYVTDGTNSQWIAVVSTPDLTPTASNLIIGPTHATNGIEYLEPIVWIKQEGEEHPYTESFEHAFVPEEVNLLSLARQAGLTGDLITVKEVVMGVGPRVEDIYLHPGQDLTITDMKFLNKNDSEIDAWGQAALKTIYDIRDVAMGDNWVDYLETNKATLDQDALKLAIGVNDSDNGLNAQTWVQQAKQADLHDEFRYFYTTGLVIMRNTSEAGSPVRGIFGKNKLWGITSETLNANLYTQAGLTAKQEVILYLDPFYENGWETDLWINSIHELYSIFREVDLLPVVMNANQLKQYMTNEQSNGTVVLLGAIPDLIWDYRNPLILESDQTSGERRQMLKNNSALEYFMENGGTVISTGQYGGGWKVSFYDDETGQTTIGDYNSTNNPVSYDFNVDIGEILYDRSFYLDGYVPTVATRMSGTGDYTTDIGNYYSLGLRDITGNKIVPIGESGNYDDMIWLVKEEGQQTLDVTDGTGLFVNFHTGTDNLSAGAINDFNFNSWLIDLIEIMTGIDISQTESYDSSVFAGSAVSKDRLYPNSDSTNGRANNPFYWYDTFLSGTEGWNNISTTTLDNEKVGDFTSPYISKNLDNVSVNEYPYLQANVYTDFTPNVIDGYDFDEFPSSPSWSGTRVEANTTHKFENDSGNSQQFYYHWFDPLSTSNTNQTGTLDFTDLVVNQDTLFSFALNPIQLEAYEYASTVNIASGNQWDKFDHASEWWLEVEIDDSSGATKKIRYFFTVATPLWYKGSIIESELGYPDNEYYEYDSGWTTEPRTNDNLEGIRWVRLPIKPDFDVNRRTDRTDEGSNPNTFTGTSTGQWTPVMRNIVNDYNVLFGQMTEELTITKINHVGHFLTGDAYVLVDDMIFSTVDTGKQVAMKTTVTDGQNSYNFIDAVSTNEWVDTLALEDESLELYYQLNSNTGTTVYDSSQNNRDSSSGTFPSWTSNSYDSFAQSSLNFNGTDDLILTDLNALKGSNAVTVSMWHKLDSSFTDMDAPWSLMTSTAAPGGDGFWWHINDTSNRIYVRVEDSGGEETTDFARTVVKNQWYLATWVISTDSISYYEDGEYVWNWSPTFDWSSLDANTLQFRLGQGYNSGYYYKGMLDNVTVFSKALSDTDIMRLFETSGRRRIGETWTTGFDDNEDNILNLSLNEGTGNTAFDQSVYQNNGTIDGATWTADELTFDGSNDYVSLGDQSEFRTNTGTVSSWIKKSNTSDSFRVVFAGGHTTSNSYYYMCGVWYNDIAIYTYNNGTNSTLARATTAPDIDDGNWHHLAWQSDGSSTSVFVDGIEYPLVYSTGSDTGLWFDDFSNNQYAIGILPRPSLYGSWYGSLEEIKIWGRVLSTQEITDLNTDQPVENYYLTGSIVPTTSFNLKNETQEGWNTLTHDFSSLIAETSTPLFYSNDVLITSWNTNTYLDNVGVVGGMLPVLPTDSNNSANYVFNQTGLVLSSTGSLGNEGVRHQLDNSKLAQDYSLISFDIMVTTIDSSGDGEVDEPEIRISTSGANHYMAELASSSSGDPDYYHYGGITTPNRWYHFELNLMNFRNLNGDRPDNQTVFNEILFLSRGTFYLDNVVLKGNSGTLISEDFEQYAYHSNYSNGILGETYFNSTWNDYNSSLSVVAEHTNINNSSIKVDIQEATELLTIVQGDSSKTLTLRLYGYREDGTKVTTGTYYLDLITTSNVLQGWNNNVEIITSLSSLSSDIRYLSCPEIIGPTGSFAILSLSTVNTDIPLNNPTSDSSNIVMDDVPHNPYGFSDNFNLGNVNNWTLTQSDNASLTFEQLGTLKIDGGDSGQGEAVPVFVIDTEAFEITYRTKVTTDDYTGWILNEGTSTTDSYRHWLDIDDSTMPKADIVVEGTTSKDLVRNVDLTEDIALNEWITYKIRKEGSKLQMWINNQLIMDVTDSSYVAPYKFGFSVNYTGIAEFDDLIIIPIESIDLTRDSPNVIYGEPTDKTPIALWDLSTKVLDPNDDPEIGGEIYWLYDTSQSKSQYNSKTISATYDEIDGAFRFNGTSDYITLPEVDLSYSNQITIAAWIKPEDITSGTHYEIIRQDHSSYSPEWLLSFQTSGTLLAFGLDAGGTYNELDVSINASDYTDGNWHYVVATYDGMYKRIFLDGQLIGSNSDSGNITYHSGTIHQIAKYPQGTEYFDGHIAFVSMYDRALTPEEILYQYAPGMVLLPASSTAVLTNPYSTSSEWILSTSFAIPEGSTIGDYLNADIGGEDLIVSTSTMTNRLSLDVTQGETTGGTFTDNFSTSWSADKNGVTSGDASPWTYGHITGSGDGNWNVGAGSSYNNQLEIHSTSDPNGGDYGEAHGVYQNVDWADDFDVKVTIGRHDTSNTWRYWGKMTLLDEDDEIITTSFIYDSWAFSTAYGNYARAYDDSNVYNATYAYASGYIYNYNATVSFRMKRTDGEIKLWVDTDGNQSWDVGDLVVTRPSSSHTTRTVKKVILEGNAGGTYWSTGWYSFDDFSMQAGGSSENSVSIEEPILYSDQSDLKLSLSLTEDEGSVVYDSSLYNNDGSLINDPVLTRITGVEFDGSNDYISTSLDLTDFSAYSVSVWFKRDGKTSREEIIGQDSIGDRVFMLEYDPNRPVGTRFYTSNGNNTIYGDDVTTGEWVHAVITEDGTTHKFYQNGILKDTGNGNIPSTSSQDLLIGRRMYFGAYDYFDGYIRNVQIWDRVLDEDEVKSLANTFNLTSGDTGSLTPVTIQPLNDLSDKIQITIDNEDLYLENAGTDTFLNTVTISDPTGEGLIFSPIIVQSVNTQLTNEDGTISTIVPYTSLGYEIQDISHTSGKHMIINIDVRVDLENPLNGTLNIQPNSTGTGYSWGVVSIGTDHNPAETIINSQWTTLQVNTHETGTSTDKIRIYVSGNTGESVLTIGRVHIVEVSDLNNLASSSGDDLDAFLPYGYEYLVKSQGHSIYMDENTLVLEDNGHDTSNSDFSYVDIPVGNTPITDRTHISFDWYLGVEDPSSTIIEAGIYLPTSSEYIYHDDHWYFEPIENWPSKYSSSIRLHEDYPSGGEGTYKSDSWALSQMGSKSYDTWYRYIGYYLMDLIDFWIARGIRKTLIPGYSPLTITLGDGNSVGDLGITTDILEPYVNDWDNDGTCDYYNTLMHLDITLNDHVEGTWLDDIRIFIDGNGSNKKFRLEISNFRVYEELPSVLSMTDRRIGDKQTSNNYLTDWVASPFYPHFDTEERLPKSNIVINGDFERYDNQITNPDPDGWTNGQFPAQSYVFKERDAWSTNGDYLFPSGKHALCLERDPDWNIFYPSTWDGATMTQSIDVGDVEADEVMVSLWVYNPQASSLLVNVNGSSPQAVTPDSGKWVYWQGMFSLDATSSFVTVLLQQFGAGYIAVDDVRVEVTGWTGDTTTYKDVSTLRGIDPLNISPYTFYDGWYEISNVVSDYIHSADVTAPQVEALWGYTQYFYTEINVDGPYSQDDTWQISLTEAQTTTNTYALWINGELQIVDKGAFTASDLTLQRGSNSILLMQNVDCYTDYVTTYFKIQLSRSSWTDYSIFSERPHINPTRSPLIYNDPQYQTKWIERDGSESDSTLDLPLGEQTGSIAIDHSYNDRNSTINGATWTTEGLTFDGSNDYIALGDQPSLETNIGTVSAWVNPNDTAAFKVVYSSGHNSINIKYLMLGIGGGEKPSIYAYNGSSLYRYGYANTSSLADGNWHHVVWQSDGTQYHFYVDGVEYALTFTQGSNDGKWFDDYDTNNFHIGRMYQTSWYGPFDGEIQAVKVWDRVLSADEIQQQVLGHNQTLNIIDVPAMLASSMSNNLASMNLPATVGNSHRLHYYIYAENNMASTGIIDTVTVTGNYDDTGYITHQVKHWQSPYLSPMYTNITDGHSAGIEYLNNNSGTTTVYWTYEINSTPEEQYPTYEYIEYKTSRLYNEAYGRKTIWHPFGSILMTTDVLPETVFDGIGWSKLEQFLEGGGKQIWSGGYIPYSYTSSGIGETPVAVTDGTSQVDYAGALGHQEVFDISSMNNGTTYGSRSNFSSGMFLSDQKDDMYDGIDTDHDGTPDEYLAIDENTPSITGVMGNLDDFNYEPIGGRSPVWTQLSHVGYSSHMVLTKHEYDIRQHLYGGIDVQNVSTKIENADGQSEESSSKEYSHRNPNDLDRTYSGVLGDGSGAIPDTMYDEHYIDPQMAGLWFMPILGDTNGAYEYKPSSYTNSPVGYYGVVSGNPIYNERWTWSHHERVNVGTGLIQAGTNGKGIVGIAPMFDWSDTINGLNTEASDSAYYKGMYADRGKGSISNSPTTESMARKFTANVTGGSVIAMLLDCISINVVRDNSTTGTNFFNFNPRNELGKEPEQYNDSFNNGVVNSLVDRKGPIVVSTYTNRNLSGGTSDWDDYLAGQSNYSLFGASFPKAVANNQYDMWEHQVYPVRKTLDTGYNLDDYDLQRIVPAWDGVNTRINIDNAFPNFTDPPGSAQTVKVLTLNGLTPDTLNDPLLYANVLTSNHADMSMYYGQYDVDSSDMPMNGINFGSDLSGTIPGFEHENFETPHATAVGWDIYNSDSSEFFNNYGNTNLIYGSSDRELVIRNSSINPMSSGIDGEYRNFGPLTYLDASEKDTLYNFSYSGWDGSEIGDGVWSGTNGWYINSQDFDADGMFVGSNGNNRLEGQFSSSDEQVNLIGVYSLYNPSDVSTIIDNTPKLIRITLINAAGEIVYTKNEILQSYSKFDTDTPPDGVFNSAIAGQPTFLNIPEGIYAKKISLEIWSVYEPSINQCYPGIGELEVYTGTNPDSKLINYTDTEFIPRAMETDAWKWITWQNPIYSIDDGNSQLIDDDPDYYRGRPSQQGNFRVNIGIKSNSKNNAMRYNAYYTSTIEVSTNQSSYEFGNQENPDPWDIFWDAIWDNLLFFVLVIVVNILVLQWISGGTSWAWVGYAVLAFDLAPIAIMAAEIILYGEIGGFTKTALYHMVGVYQIYNIIMDWDSAIVRFCFLDFEAPFKVIFDY